MTRGAWLFREAVGEEPTAVQIGAILVVVAVAVLVVYAARPFGWQTALLMVFAADIAGGVVSNAAASTRRHWARMPGWVPAVFVAVHLIELPVIWWLAGGDVVFWGLGAAMFAKIGVFLIGQDEYRWRPRP